MMQSIVWTGRLLSRALWNGISNYSTNCAEPNVSRKRESRIVSAVCGFPKELAHARLKKGQFGDDAWFTAKYKSADVIGEYNFFHYSVLVKICVSVKVIEFF
jgi:protein phosphatase PTC7